MTAGGVVEGDSEEGGQDQEGEEEEDGEADQQGKICIFNKI